MRKIIRALFLVFLLTGSNIHVEAASVKKQRAIKTDSSRIEARTFDQPALNQYKSQKEFQYGADYQTAQSVWIRFWKWFWNYFDAIISDVASNTATKNISILLLTGLLIFFVVKLSGIGVLQLFTGKPQPVPISYSESLENIHEIDFEPEINKAIYKQDYRLAVRMLYLKCLKNLSDSGLITWENNKTNSNYISELVNSARKEKFTFLTRQFEFIWYGEFKIDLCTFNEIHDGFKDFNNDL